MDVAESAKSSRARVGAPAIAGVLERYALLAFLIVMLGFAALASPAFLGQEIC